MTRLQGEVRFSGLGRWAAELGGGLPALYRVLAEQLSGAWRIPGSARVCQRIFVKVVTVKAVESGNILQHPDCTRDKKDDDSE